MVPTLSLATANLGTTKQCLQILNFPLLAVQSAKKGKAVFANLGTKQSSIQTAAVAIGLVGVRNPLGKLSPNLQNGNPLITIKEVVTFPKLITSHGLRVAIYNR